MANTLIVLAYFNPEYKGIKQMNGFALIGKYNNKAHFARHCVVNSLEAMTIAEWIQLPVEEKRRVEDRLCSEFWVKQHDDCVMVYEFPR